MPGMPNAQQWPFTELPTNARRVFDVLRRAGPATRAGLAETTGLSRATVSAALAALAAAGLMVESGGPPGSEPAPGRRPSVVRLAPRAGLAVGVDIGRRHVRVAVADLGHEVLSDAAAPLRPGVEAKVVLDLAAELVGSALKGSGLPQSAVVGVGMGLPAPVDQRSGQISAPTILPEWAGIAAGEELARRLGLPVVVDNDANLGALAEHMWGAGRGYQTVAYIKAATGIGGGLIVAGRLFRGIAGTAGEIGHMMLDERGDMCKCGNRGCLELEAGGNALVAALRRSNREVSGLPELIRLVRSGDTACQRIVADAGTSLGIAVGGLVNLVNPQRIIVGGQLGRAGEVLLEPMRLALRRSAVRPAVDAVEVVSCGLDDRSEVLGAVAVVLREPELLQ